MSDEEQQREIDRLAREYPYAFGRRVRPSNRGEWQRDVRISDDGEG